MELTKNAKEYAEKLFNEEDKSLLETDPEFMERILNFSLDEVKNHGNLDNTSRWLAILATLIGCQGIDLFKVMVKASLKDGLTPEQVKEVIYQATAYLGAGRTYGFLLATNSIFKEEGIVLPLAPQATTTLENRLQKGNQAQVDIFGEGMKGSYEKGGETQRINYWLADNCFGDYYTRGTLDLRQRELITFCFIASQGGCEPQLIAHAKGNMNMGNTKEMLIEVVSQCVPYIGYPRSLNAIRCIQEAASK